MPVVFASPSFLGRDAQYRAKLASSFAVLAPTVRILTEIY